MTLPPELNYAALRGFFAVARTRSFSKAAILLRVQQPAISKMVRAVELELGCRLVHSTRGGVELTPDGTAVAEVCERLFDEARAIDAVGRRRSPRPRGELFVATHDHVATYLLPGAVEILWREAPELVVRILTGPATLFLPGLGEGRPEVGVFFGLPRGKAVDRLVVARAPCQLVVRAGLEDDQAVLASFIGSREVDDLSNKVFPTVRMLQALRPGTRITVSCNGLEAHKALALRGVGVTILPLFTVRGELSRGELRVVHPEYLYTADLELVSKRGAKPSRAASTFIRVLKRELATLHLT